MTPFLIIGAIGVALALGALLVGDVLDDVLQLEALDSDLFSISSISAFVGAFGFGGALGVSLVDNIVVAVASGLIIGGLAAWGAIWLTRKLKHDVRHTFRAESLIGHPARVITAIPLGGYGEVRVVAGGHVRKVSARAERPIETGAEVWVSAVVSPTAVEVRPASESPEVTA